MTYYFTSDSHFCHARILQYSNRPFKTVDEMNEALIANWNNTVNSSDYIYHLGDFCLGRAEEAVNIVSRLNGNKFLLFGNHDKYTRKNKEFLRHWQWAKDYAEITINDQAIILNHYAYRTFSKMHYGSWDLYGHSHGSLPDLPNVRQLDVGVDCWNYTPVSFEQIKERMDLKTWKPVDHHGARGDGY